MVDAILDSYGQRVLFKAFVEMFKTSKKNSHLNIIFWSFISDLNSTRQIWLCICWPSGLNNHNQKHYIHITCLGFRVKFQISSLKGPRHNSSSKFSNVDYPIIKSRKVNINIFNALSKFENQIMSYKQDTYGSINEHTE